MYVGCCTIYHTPYPVEIYHPHLSAGAGEPRWLQEEKDNFKEKLDKNGDGKLDKVCACITPAQCNSYTVLQDELASWIIPDDGMFAIEEAEYLMSEADVDKVTGQCTLHVHTQQVVTIICLDPSLPSESYMCTNTLLGDGSQSGLQKALLSFAAKYCFIYCFSTCLSLSHKCICVE